MGLEHVKSPRKPTKCLWGESEEERSGASSRKKAAPDSGSELSAVSSELGIVDEETLANWIFYPSAYIVMAGMAAAACDAMWEDNRRGRQREADRNTRDNDNCS